MATTLPTSRVEIRLACENLPNMDFLSKTDCCIMAFVLQSFQQPPGDGILVGRTEVIRDNLNPVFSTPIVMDYSFEKEQKVRFLVLDIDVKDGRIDQQDYIGVVESTLGNLISNTANGKTAVKPIVNHKKLDSSKFKNTRMKLSIEEVSDNKSSAKFFLRATVPKKGLLSRPDPFFRIFRTKEDGQEVAVYTSSVVKNSTEPIWENISASVQALSNGDMDRALTFRFYDWEKSGDHIYIGEFQASVNDMKPGPNGYKDFGMLKVESKVKREKIGGAAISKFALNQEFSFLDYIKGGCQINLSVAIDFTASNGDPRTPQSLHFRNQQAMNHYQQALYSVGTILQDYDTDKMFPAFGFGAQLPTGEVSHCWAINGNPQQPECAGVDGLMQAYSLALDHVKLYGPTNFSPVINSRCDAIEGELQKRNQQGTQAMPWVYHILLIITDGEITDMDATIRAVVRASNLPMSIIIVGVGSGCDFNNMKALDGDNHVLRDDNGRQAARDIVQFVAMKDVMRPGQADYRAELARELLAELPAQIVHYFKSRGLAPEKMCH